MKLEEIIENSITLYSSFKCKTGDEIYMHHQECSWTFQTRGDNQQEESVITHTCSSFYTGQYRNLKHL